jgi:photosystem II stability/assembly factor-like uncharacterized protein
MDKQSRAGVFAVNIPSLMIAIWLVFGLMPVSVKSESAIPDTAAPEAEYSAVVMNSSLFGMDLSGQNNVWLVGKLGAIVCTRDGGKTWSLQKSGEKLHLYDVSFCDARNGWAVGENGLIIHTIDGGKIWEPQQSGLTGNLRGIQCLDASTAWAAGHEGALLKTVDGGKTWILQKNVQDVLRQLNRKFLPSFFCVRFSDARNGYAVGHPGIILHTADGGETWQQQSSGTSAVLYKVAVLDHNTAWISGGAGVILHTTNGGAAWVAQNSGVNFMLNSIAFAGEVKGFAVGHKCILHTEDGGGTWSKYDIPLSRWLCAIKFSDAQNGWAVGDSGTIYHTEDGGKNWKLVSAQLQ